MQPGMRIGQYVLIEQIGQGGQATVWSAEDEQLRRTVAFKTINLTMQVQPGVQASSLGNSTLPSLDEQVQRFRAEARTIADLEHPYILPVYAFGQYEDWLYIVMRYMPGGTLKKLIQQHALSVDEVIKIAEPLADALDQAHQRNIVHRDIKSVNVLLDAQHRPYLADFGLSVTAGDASAISGSGTLSYMAPEVLRSDMFDHRSDIYSFGILLYEMLTGSTPSVNNQHWNLMQMMNSIDLPPSLDIPFGVFNVLKRATDSDPEVRYSSAAMLIEDLKDFMKPPEEVDPDTILLPISDPAMQAMIDASNMLESALGKWADGAGRFRLYEEDFQYIDSFYDSTDNWGLALDEAGRRLMLRGALEYGYHLDEWWSRTESLADRRAVTLQTLVSELPAARHRALGKLTTLEDSSPPAIPIRVATIIRHDPDADVRLAGLNVLGGRASRSTEWRETAYDADIDQVIAHLAATDPDPRVSEAAARAVSKLRSTCAITQIVNVATGTSANASQALQSLIDARDEAPNLPASVPPTLRRRAFVALTMRQLLSRGYWSRFVSALLGFTIAWIVYTVAAAVDQYGADAATNFTPIVLSTIGNALVSGLFWGAVMAIPITASIEITQRLRVWSQIGRTALGLVIGSLLFVVAFWLLRLLYYFYAEPLVWAQYLLLCVLIAAGFALPAGLLKQTWLRAVLAIVAIYVALSLNYDYQVAAFDTTGDALLIYLPFTKQVPLIMTFAASLGVLSYLPEWWRALRPLFSVRTRGRAK